MANKFQLFVNGVQVWGQDTDPQRLEVRLDSYNTVFDSDNPKFDFSASHPTSGNTVSSSTISAPPASPFVSSGMDFPSTEKDLNDALANAAASHRICVLDPRTQINITQTIVLSQASADGNPWGVKGNGAKIAWKGAAGGDMLKIVGTQGQPNRALTVEGLMLYGGGYDGTPAGDCLKLSAPLGDNGPIYRFLLRDIYTSYGTRGIVLEGGVYEGFCENIQAEGMTSHGMETLHLPNNATISNINIMHPNLSRNLGAGLKCTYSTNVMFGSFILNALGGIIAPDGLRFASGNNGENTGEALFIVPSNGYGSVITGNELSGDASTVARKMVSGAWQVVGSPSLYLLDGANDIIQRDNHCSYYGADQPNPMRVFK
jgi:hypothetical protein